MPNQFSLFVSTFFSLMYMGVAVTVLVLVVRSLMRMAKSLDEISATVSRIEDGIRDRIRS